MNSTSRLLPVPDFFNPDLVSQIYRVPYQSRAIDAAEWSQHHKLQPAKSDRSSLGLLLIDVQNTFCLPEFELFVGGSSGMGAVEDNIRLCQFIYRHLGMITEVIPTLDSHHAVQIFHPVFWQNQAGEPPQPLTTIHLAEVEEGTWQVNPSLGYGFQGGLEQLQQHVLHYVRQLSHDGKYPLTIWPYHGMLGGLGHALVSAVEDAIFFHSVARQSYAKFQLKGDNPLTENYSVLSPEVLTTVNHQSLAQKNTELIDKLLNFERLLIAGQAKSHCVAWTVDNLLTEILERDPQLARKIYLLEDCMSPVAIPGVVDFTPEANVAFEKFAVAGMNRLLAQIRMY
ncbi:MAG: isochorismatase [Cyanobacteria bacterium J06621_8]